MKAIVIYEAGGPEKLIYTQVPTPRMKEGWSLVRIQGFGINHSEIFTRKGESPSVKFPRILGIECVGVIEESEVYPKGQQIISIMGEMGRAFDGSYAEFALLPNEQIYTVETDLPIETLAAFPETYYTAYGSMLNLKISGGDSVLVRGATSGVGIAFMKLLKAKYPTIKVTGSSRKEAKIQRLLNVGFDEVVLDIHNELRTQEKYDRVLDLIGPAALRNTFTHMNEGSIVCVTGLLGNQWTLPDFDPLVDMPVNSYITSFHSGNVTSEKMQEILDFIREYKVEIKAEKVFALKDVPKAHEYLESADSFGKVVVLNDA